MREIVIGLVIGYIVGKLDFKKAIVMILVVALLILGIALCESFGIDIMGQLKEWYSVAKSWLEKITKEFISEENVCK